MLLYSALFLCTLITFNGGVVSSPLTQQELFSKIGNYHMLANKDASTLKNAQKPEIYEEYLARDCRAAFLRGRKENGLYVIRPKYSPLLAVYCDMEYDGGGWTVLHKNEVNQKAPWSNTWDAYKRGFGDLLGNHWLGNEFIHLLTNQNAFTVRFLIVDSNGKTKNADYHSFKVDSEDNGYALRLGNYSGNAGDALTTVGESGVHDNMRFSSQDRDNDRRSDTNCALDNAGGWWYDNCYSALLTSDNHIRWKGLCTEVSSCKLAAILIRPNGQNCNLSSRY
ncbi:fibrinogen-like protein 1-like protein [Eublepharis macularius]|uniref:Fibrinogen-like protein 1-like protein n=1 Tax=Eublepharis macularius TaxID=481883 RepID=A0AA97KLJ3_EUBMA|nr:fibrinogen-like protein 1-like protein [Eublepharis macularius]